LKISANVKIAIQGFEIFGGANAPLTIPLRILDVADTKNLELNSNWWTLWTKYIFTREYKSLQAIVFQLHEVSTYQYMISKDKEPIF